MNRSRQQQATHKARKAKAREKHLKDFKSGWLFKSDFHWMTQDRRYNRLARFKRNAGFHEYQNEFLKAINSFCRRSYK